MRSVTTLRLGLPTEHALSTETDLHTDATPDVDLMSAPIVEPKTFAELGVHPKTVEALAEDGIITAFPIQELTLPLALATHAGSAVVTLDPQHALTQTDRSDDVASAALQILTT